MSNTQLYLGVGLPTIAVLASLVNSLVHVSGIPKDIREMRNDVKRLKGEIHDLIGHLG